MATFRDAVAALSPSRLRTSSAARFVYAMIGLPMDGFAQAHTDVARQGLASQCTDDALPYHGRDRRILRGPGESRAGYVARLIGWLDAWRFAGVGSSMLDQLAAYVTPHAMRIRIVTDTGIWYTREADGTFSVTHEDRALWNWDNSLTTKWSRFWVILYPPSGLWTPNPTWGDADLWGGAWGSPGFTWGTTATPEEVASVRAIVKQWKPAFALCVNIIIAFDDDSFSQLSTDLPAGEYRRRGKYVGGHYVRARLASARYWDGV